MDSTTSNLVYNVNDFFSREASNLNHPQQTHMDSSVRYFFSSLTVFLFEGFKCQTKMVYKVMIWCLRGSSCD